MKSRRMRVIYPGWNYSDDALSGAQLTTLEERSFRCHRLFKQCGKTPQVTSCVTCPLLRDPFIITLE